MRLLTPSPGEVVDRITILDLKITAFEKANKDAAFLVAERMALKDYIKTWDDGLKEDLYGADEVWTQKIDQIREKTNGLIAVNSLLWVAEDDVRNTPATEAFKLARLCKQIAELNDARGRMVTELSQAYGTQEQSEKIFGVKIGR